MRTFSLNLQSAGQCETIADVVSFIGADGSGSFGLLAGHAPMLTVVDFGLSRFRTADGAWHYMALPGGVLYFRHDQLYLATRRYVRGDDYRGVADSIEGVLAAEEAAMQDLKNSIARLEREMTRRLWELQHGSKHGYG